jgi:DNA polymerase-1
LASARQLGEFLFDNLKLPGGRKTKTGQWETRAGLLDDLAASEESPRTRPQADQRYAGMAATDEIDVDLYGLATPTHQCYDRPYPYQLRAGVHDHRTLGSTDPNLQNIPIRTKEGREIRTAFIAERGHKLISPTTARSSLRVLAHIADIHS